MKSVFFLIPLAACAVFASAPDDASANAPGLEVRGIEKAPHSLQRTKSQAGPSGVEKERDYAEMIMEAQPHLRPQISSVANGEDDEK